MKVLFHVVEAEKWGPTLVNVRDLLNSQEDVEIKIIAMNKAAGLFNRYSGIDFEGILGNSKVEIIISQSALKENNLQKEILPEGIRVETLVISKIAELQNQGYAYIRL